MSLSSSLSSLNPSSRLSNKVQLAADTQGSIAHGTGGEVKRWGITYSLLSLRVLSTPCLLLSILLLSSLLDASSTSLSSSPSSESYPASEVLSDLAMTSRSCIRVLQVDGSIRRPTPLCNLARNEEVWFDIVSRGRYWLYRPR